MDQDALQCLPDCTGHGTFDLDTQTCNCEPKWSGDDCSKGTYFAHITTHPYHLQNLPNALGASLGVQMFLIVFTFALLTH